MWTVGYYDPATLAYYTELHDTRDAADASASTLYRQRWGIGIKVAERIPGTGCAYLSKEGTTWVPLDTIDDCRDYAKKAIERGDTDSVNIYVNWEDLVETVRRKN
jgi:hypothetical protein